MIRVHVLSHGFGQPNIEAMLFPLLTFRSALAEAGYEVDVFHEEHPSALSADVLLVDDKYFTTGQTWYADRDAVLAKLDAWRSQVERLAWFDTTASTGTLQSDVLDHVDLYLRGQLLEDRSRYCDALYGDRIHTEYYHRRFGVGDHDPLPAHPIEKSQTTKLAIGWNSAYGHYGPRRPWIRRLYRWTGWSRVLRYPSRWTAPSVDRPVDVSARFGAPYDRATVRFQRERILDQLDSSVPTERLDRRAYFKELRRSKLALSPFGWGEKCYRDYEAFLCGALLVKPDMSHMETWPALYDDQTMVGLDWDLDDVPSALGTIVDDYERYVDRAREGQRQYRELLQGDDAGRRFADRFGKVIQRVKKAVT